MEQRLQQVNNDTVLELIESAPTKRRLSEKALLRHKGYLEQSIAHFHEQLGQVTSDLRLIATAKDEAARK